MPSGKVHVLFGLLIAVAVAGIIGFEKFNVVSILISLAVVFVYSQIPDIDHPMSRVTAMVTFGGLSISLYILFVTNQKLIAGIILGLLCLLWGARLFKLLKHRGLMHNFFLQPVFALPLAYIGLNYFIIGTACGVSHVVLDKFMNNFRRKK